MAATSTTARVKVDGLKELDRRLGRLPDRVAKKVLRTAIADAAAPVLRAARALAPSETGLLRRSISARLRSYRRQRIQVAVIGPKWVGAPKYRQGLPRGKRARNPANYGHLVEGGTTPHVQRGVTIPGVFIRLAGIRHPGAKKQEFLTPAWKANKTRVLTRLKRRLFVEIEKVARGL